MVPLYGIILAAILSLLHFFSEAFAKITKVKGKIFLSLSAGILITLIFIEMIPTIAIATATYTGSLFYMLLLGFAVFHLIEKHAYHHHHNKKQRIKEITNLHSYGFFLEHFIIGFFLVLILKSSLTAGLLAIIPFALMTVGSSISLEAIHHVAKKNLFKKIFLASSTLLGAITATFLQVSPGIFYYSLSLIVGAIMYIVTRDIIPTEEKEKQTIYFLLGIIITLFSLYFSKTIL